ncbi:hypothetical protein [Geomicrobium sp. JCM 19039]|nr:hypothetical protein [Geomicrobium sp. JCM 19039]
MRKPWHMGIGTVSLVALMTACNTDEEKADVETGDGKKQRRQQK